MTKRILVYGATGFSGRLIAAYARARLDLRPTPVEFVIGGRDERALADISAELDLPYTAFALDDRTRVEAVLSSFDVVLNAAGPFAQTAYRLVCAAIATGCHYVDINGEVDVYQKLDDLGRPAAIRDVALVSGAGFTSAVSDVLLDHALDTLKAADDPDRRIGEVRIAVSGMADFSRGSVMTMLRSVREQVLVVRRDELAHEPVGRIDRFFNFAAGGSDDAANGSRLGTIASAVNVLDTLSAFRTIRRRKLQASGGITSFVEMPLAVRHAYQVGALGTVLLQLPLVQQAARASLSMLPEGPAAATRAGLRQTVLLQIDGLGGEPLLDWRLDTPNVYDVTAACAVNVALGVAAGSYQGWKTPSEVLRWPSGVTTGKSVPRRSEDAFTGCILETRRVPFAAPGRQS